MTLISGNTISAVTQLSTNAVWYLPALSRSRPSLSIVNNVGVFIGCSFAKSRPVRLSRARLCKRAFQIDRTRLSSSRGDVSGFACRVPTAARPTAGLAVNAGPVFSDMQSGSSRSIPPKPYRGGRGCLRNVPPNLSVGLRGRAASVPGFLSAV